MNHQSDRQFSKKKQKNKKHIDIEQRSISTKYLSVI